MSTFDRFRVLAAITVMNVGLTIAGRRGRQYMHDYFTVLRIEESLKRN